MGVLTEEVAEELHRYALAYLEKHPAYGLMHQVVGVVKMYLGIAQAPGRVVLLCGLPRADHAHSLLPEVLAGGELIEYLSFVVKAEVWCPPPLGG